MYRNGTGERSLETRLGELDLKIPKLRKGSYLPSLLTPRKRSEEALLAVVQEAYIQGVSTRRMDELAKTLGLQGIDAPTLDGRRQGKQGLPNLQRAG